MTKILPYDSAEFLSTPEAMAAYLDEAFASNDHALISHALGVVARAKSMTEIARKTGLSRESLYRALSAGGRPELSTIVKVMAALDLQLTAHPTRPDPAVRKRIVRKRAQPAKPATTKRYAMA